MSAPEQMETAATAFHAAGTGTALHFFADYEIHVGLSLHRWGSVTSACDIADASGFDADALVRQPRDKAAARCCADACDVRVRNICRP